MSPEQAECVARAATAAAAKDQDERASRSAGDPFADEDTPERRAFVAALNALAKTTVRRFPGAGVRSDAERREDERSIVDACAEVCRAAGLPGPDDLLRLRLEIGAWREATGCVTPEDACDRSDVAAIVMAPRELDAGARANGTPAAEPQAGEVWEDKVDGERILLLTRRPELDCHRGPGWYLEIVRGRRGGGGLSVGARCGSVFEPHRLRRVESCGIADAEEKVAARVETTAGDAPAWRAQVEAQINGLRQDLSAEAAHVSRLVVGAAWAEDLAPLAKRLEVLDVDVEALRARVVALESRAAPKPDSLSEACAEVAMAPRCECDPARGTDDRCPKHGREEKIRKARAEAVEALDYAGRIIAKLEALVALEAKP